MSHLAHLLDTKNGHGSYLHQNFILWYFQIVVTIIDDCDNVQRLALNTDVSSKDPMYFIPKV